MQEWRLRRWPGCSNRARAFTKSASVCVPSRPVRLLVVATRNAWLVPPPSRSFQPHQLLAHADDVRLVRCGVLLRRGGDVGNRALWVATVVRFTVGDEHHGVAGGVRGQPLAQSVLEGSRQCGGVGVSPLGAVAPIALAKAAPFGRSSWRPGRRIGGVALSVAAKNWSEADRPADFGSAKIPRAPGDGGPLRQPAADRVSHAAGSVEHEYEQRGPTMVGMFAVAQPGAPHRARRRSRGSCRHIPAADEAAGGIAACRAGGAGDPARPSPARCETWSARVDRRPTPEKVAQDRAVKVRSNVAPHACLMRRPVTWNRGSSRTKSGMLGRLLSSRVQGQLKVNEGSATSSTPLRAEVGCSRAARHRSVRQRVDGRRAGAPTRAQGRRWLTRSRVMSIAEMSTMAWLLEKDSVREVPEVRSKLRLDLRRAQAIRAVAEDFQEGDARGP